MAKATEITVDVKVNIPDETICRCLRVLEMWMDDNPNKWIVVDTKPYKDGNRHKIHIEDKDGGTQSKLLEESGFEL